MTKELTIRILCGDVLATNEQVDEAVKMAIKAIEAEPVKHGHWKPFGEYDRECSCCCGIVDTTNYRYCPNCGAKMDESTMGQVKRRDAVNEEVKP